MRAVLSVLILPIHVFTYYDRRAAKQAAASPPDDGSGGSSGGGGDVRGRGSSLANFIRGPHRVPPLPPLPPAGRAQGGHLPGHLHGAQVDRGPHGPGRAPHPAAEEEGYLPGEEAVLPLCPQYDTPAAARDLLLEHDTCGAPPPEMLARGRRPK